MSTTDTTLQDRKFRSFFDYLDVDKDGAISWSDILRPVEKMRQGLGWATTDPRYTMVMQFSKGGWDSCLQICDADKSGTISYKEFVTFFFKTALDAAMSGKPPAWTVMAGNGATQAEYTAYLHAIGSDADAKAAYAKLDTNKDGKITMDELNKLAWEWMGSNDPSAPGNYLMTGKI